MMPSRLEFANVGKVEVLGNEKPVRSLAVTMQ
jgi:hypothetical protein